MKASVLEIMPFGFHDASDLIGRLIRKFPLEW
jgi:hypothetical protein